MINLLSPSLSFVLVLGFYKPQFKVNFTAQKVKLTLNNELTKKLATCHVGGTRSLPMV